MQALNKNGFFYKKYEVQAFEKGYGKNGKIDWFTFLSHLREPMGPERRELVSQVFDLFDKENQGKVVPEVLCIHPLMKFHILIQTKSKLLSKGKNLNKPSLKSFSLYLLSTIVSLQRNNLSPIMMIII